VRAHALAEHFAQRRLAGTDRAADADAQGIRSSHIVYTVYMVQDL
jgi:hypothetical protein